MDKTDAMYKHQKVFTTDRVFDPENGTGDPNIKAKYICEEETWEYLVYYIATEVEWLEDYFLVFALFTSMVVLSRSALTKWVAMPAALIFSKK